MIAKRIQFYVTMFCLCVFLSAGNLFTAMFFGILTFLNGLCAYNVWKSSTKEERYEYTGISYINKLIGRDIFSDED